MIGVIAKKSEENIAREFFELFKVPWEFYEEGKEYDVILATGGIGKNSINAPLAIVYAAGQRDGGHEAGIETGTAGAYVLLESCLGSFPVYGKAEPVCLCGSPVLVSGAGGIFGVCTEAGPTRQLYLGYNLFREVEFLLSSGQPARFASIPTLEMHIALIRKWIVEAGIMLVEVPPLPSEGTFFACLTHDVDFYGIRRHVLDHTFWGFIYRAGFQSLARLMNGRLSWRKARKNLMAVLSLPFIHIGMAKDFMVQFDRYLEIEKGLRSTFFLIPFKNRAGLDGAGREHTFRAVSYDVDDISGYIGRFRESGCEVGLHGIDAWLDAGRARAEMARITASTGCPECGVRMHWLYYDGNSPAVLEEAGFSYDSTFGYNEAVGYRAGTAQAFRPLNAVGLLELPMIIQDTALFFSSRMGLREEEALAVAGSVISDVQKYGGCLTVNWHERSIGPERLWDDAYIALLENVKNRRACFRTASQVVKWFKKRRAVTFKKVDRKADGLHVEMSVDATAATGAEIPDLVLRLHKLKKPAGPANDPGGIETVDIPFHGEFLADLPFDFAASQGERG